MSEVDFDVIVVGAGIAGSITALLLARGGLSVALLERGEAPGTKNLSGGVLYSQVMTRIMDEFLTRAPVERRIDRNQLCFLNEDSWVGIDYRDERLAVGEVAVTVLRGRLDAWLAEQAEEVGVMMMTSIRVDGVLRDGDRIVGVVADEEEVRSHVVVAADGVNSFLARAAGLRDHAAPSQLGVGIKALVQLDEDTITQRFALAPGRGAAFAFVGDCTQGIGGGGFLYTNRSSLSVGLVLRLDALRDSRRHAREVFQHYLGHPMLAQYLEGGQIMEYGCHLVAEGGRTMRGRIVHDGFVLVGDAAGLTLNTGFTVRGMDLAAASAIAAAEAIIEAFQIDDLSARGLAGYEARLDDSFAGRDMRTYARAPHFLETQRLYGAYGALLADMMHGVFGLDATPRRRLLHLARDRVRGSGLRYRDLARDAVKAVRSL